MLTVHPEHKTIRILERKFHGTPYYLHECECGSAKFEDSGLILTPKGKIKFLTATVVLEPEDFEVRR